MATVGFKGLRIYSLTHLETEYRLLYCTLNYRSSYLMEVVSL